MLMLLKIVKRSYNSNNIPHYRNFIINISGVVHSDWTGRLKKFPRTDIEKNLNREMNKIVNQGWSIKNIMPLSFTSGLNGADPSVQKVLITATKIEHFEIK